MTRPLGGFLPLRLPAPAPAPQPILALWTAAGVDAWFLHNARSALRALWAAVGPGRIWLPAYACREVAAAAPAGAQVRYYPVGTELVPDVDMLAANIGPGDHVLAIDYFGRPADARIAELARTRPDVGWIEDRAQALDPGSSPWADWAVYSPRKVTGVPDGGLLVAYRAPLPPLDAPPSDDLSFMLPALERYDDVAESDNARWYARYRQAEDAMSTRPQAMSRLSRSVLAASDAHADGRSRRDNYAALHRLLAEWALFAEPDVAYAPLGFPLRAPSAAELVRALAVQRIYAARHWADLPSAADAFPAEHRLAGELVTLPCDYRYSEDDMRRMADAVIGALRRGAH